MRLGLGLLLWFIAAAVACAENNPRTWTDVQGRTMEAVFVRVVNGTAVFQRGKQVLKVPYSQLSTADQDRIRAQLKREGHEDQLPPAPIATSSETDEPAGKAEIAKSGSSGDHTTAAEAMRVWTDADGRKIVARFERWSGNESDPVILRQANGPLIVAFNKFSGADQDRLRSLVPDRAPAANAAGGNSSASTTPPTQPWNPRAGTPNSPARPTARTYSPPIAAAPTYTPPNARSAPASSPTYAPRPTYTPPVFTPPVYTPPAAPPQQVATAPTPAYQPRSAPVMEEHYRCSQCGHDFGPYRPALGSACPQCGATFGYIRHADGRIEGNGGSSAYEIGEKAGKITAVILVVGGIAWIIKRVASA